MNGFMLKQKLWRKFMWVVAVLVLSGGTVVSVRAQGGYQIYLPLIRSVNPFEANVILLTNQHRAAVGCGPLMPNQKLNTLAYNHSQDMALNDFFSHTSPTQGGVSARLAAVGYTWSGWAENIAIGYSTPSEVMTGWLNSPGHRANIENCNLTEIGVGYFYLQNDTGNINYYHYWTQTFGRP